MSTNVYKGVGIKTHIHVYVDSEQPLTGTDCSEKLEYGYGIPTENGRKIYQIEW